MMTLLLDFIRAGLPWFAGGVFASLWFLKVEKNDIEPIKFILDSYISLIFALIEKYFS